MRIYADWGQAVATSLASYGLLTVRLLRCAWCGKRTIHDLRDGEYWCEECGKKR